MTQPSPVSRIVDLDRYPIDRPDAAAALVADCRTALSDDGACQLPGFLRPGAVRRLVAEAEAERYRAHRTDDTHSVYLESPVESTVDFAVDTSDDPRSMLQRSAKSAVAWDRVGACSDLRTLYEWEPFTVFVAAALGLPGLHRYADPLGTASMMIFDDGDELGWHFDRSPFAVTLMLQPAVEGGAYEYHQDLRGPGAENVGGVVAALRGERTDRVTLPNEAGTLSLFRGRNSLHRVTPVRGGRPRVNAVLAWSTTPDDRLNDLTRELFYGRRT